MVEKWAALSDYLVVDKLVAEKVVLMVEELELMKEETMVAL